MPKEFKVIRNEINLEQTAGILTDLSQEGWKVVQFTDHLTLLEKDVIVEVEEKVELITEGE